nr:PREDICTED: melanoregulin-like isoform X1 [Lepisosteus oculatus]
MGLTKMFCCCWCDTSDKTSGNEALSMSSGSDYGSDRKTQRAEDWNLWSSPQDSSHTESDDDRELYNLLIMRNEVDKNTEVWEKLNYDIHTFRYIRREVKARWKKILLKLGFQKEVDTLLSVNKQSTLSDSGNFTKAREYLSKLLEETSLFPKGCEAQERYLIVMDRLVSLDSAEDFLKLAMKKYPKNCD